MLNLYKCGKRRSVIHLCHLNTLVALVHDMAFMHSTNGEKTMLKQFLKYILLLPAILFVLLTSTQAQAACNATTFGNGNWSTVGIWSCGHIPLLADDVVIPTNTNVTLSQDATVNSITVSGSGILASTANFFLTLTATVPIINSSTLMSRVKLSIDKDHTINGIIIFGLQWETSLTAPRTLTINGTITLAGGGFNLDGTATNPVTLAGTGDIMNGDGSGVTVNNCIMNSATMTHVTCNAPIVNNTVSAPIDLNMNKPVETFATEVDLK